MPFYWPRVIAKQRSRIYVSLFACFWRWASGLFCREFVNPGQKASGLAASRHYCKLSRTTQLQDQTNLTNPPNHCCPSALTKTERMHRTREPTSWFVLTVPFLVRFLINTNVCVVRCGAVWSLQDYARLLRSRWLGAVWPHIYKCRCF